MPTLNLTNQELATVLHGLRMIQETANGYADCLMGCCDHFDEVEALSDSEIDTLCERLNDPAPSESITTVTIKINQTCIATGNDLAEYIEQVVNLVKYNMGPEPARSTNGWVYERIDYPHGPQVGTWTVKL